MKKSTKIVLILTLTVLGLVFSPLTFSRSNEPCQSCHGSKYYQYLDILEGDSGNQIPSALNVNQTFTVKVVVRNDVSSPRYTEMNRVTLTLSSTFGHFQVNNPTYTINNLSPGTATATWQITAISEGYDYIDIQAAGYNSHYSSFYDYYSPAPLITIGSPTGTPPPMPTPTPAPPTPTPTIPPASTTAPTQTATLTNTPTTTSQPSATPAPTQTTMPTQNLNSTAEEPNPETFNWTTTAILVAAAVIAVVAAVFVVIKLRAKKQK